MAKSIMQEIWKPIRGYEGINTLEEAKMAREVVIGGGKYNAG